MFERWIIFEEVLVAYTGGGWGAQAQEQTISITQSLAAGRILISHLTD